MDITKTDYLNAINCRKNVWLKLHHRDIYHKYHQPPTETEAMFIDEGIDIEKYALKYFEGVIDANNGDLAEVVDKGKILYQPTIKNDKLHARCDFLVKVDDNIFDIYEVKSSSNIDKRYTNDLFFQKYILENEGYEVRNAFIMNINKHYVFKNNLDVNKLFKLSNLTEDINEKHGALESELLDIKEFLLSHGEVKEGDGCDCLYKTAGNHCDTFEYFNRKRTDTDIYTLSGIRKKRLTEFINEAVEDIRDLNEHTELKEKQLLQVESAKLNQPVVKRPALSGFIDSFEFPLYFLDYEVMTFMIPQLDNTRPRQNLVFQYSLHILHQDMRLEHKEFIIDDTGFEERLVKDLVENIKPKGTILSWHKQYENKINKELAERYPRHQEELRVLIERTKDLMDVFKNFYFDYRFKGKTSIKKVLPVLCPELSYETLEVQNGVMAQKIFTEFLKNKDEGLKRDLLEYCKLDTYAMVAIYKKLIAL